MSSLRKAIKNVPGVPATYNAVRRLRHALRSFPSPFVRHFPAGHFYSPLPDMAEVRSRQDRLFDQSVTQCTGIDLNEAGQLAVLDELARFYPDLPFTAQQSADCRYYYDNLFYVCGDAIVLYGMLRRLQPKRVIEVGSGFSSAVMLDTNDKFLGGQTRFTFVEPYPDRLLSLLTEQDRKQHEIITKSVQDLDLQTFDVLEAGDILFIDSSHVVKVGSDVRHLIWEVLPRLKPGVVVHVHDIFWPFEYPKDWVYKGNAWNEAYFLRAFLQFNKEYSIEYFNSYIATHHRSKLESKMPRCMSNAGAGIWLRRV